MIVWPEGSHHHDHLSLGTQLFFWYNNAKHTFHLKGNKSGFSGFIF